MKAKASRSAPDTTSNAAPSNVVSLPHGNIIQQMMVLTGSALRTVFSDAINAWRTQKERVTQEHETALNELRIKRESVHATIEDLNRKITAEHETLRALSDKENRVNEEYSLIFDGLDEHRVMIENLQVTFKHKLDGFEE